MVAKRKLTIETLTKLGRRKLAELPIAEAAGNRRLTYRARRRRHRRQLAWLAWLVPVGDGSAAAPSPAHSFRRQCGGTPHPLASATPLERPKSAATCRTLEKP